jgi:hypothetical protein
MTILALPCNIIDFTRFGRDPGIAQCISQALVRLPWRNHDAPGSELKNRKKIRLLIGVGKKDGAIGLADVRNVDQKRITDGVGTVEILFSQDV